MESAEATMLQVLSEMEQQLAPRQLAEAALQAFDVSTVPMPQYAIKEQLGEMSDVIAQSEFKRYVKETVAQDPEDVEETLQVLKAYLEAADRVIESYNRVLFELPQQVRPSDQGLDASLAAALRQTLFTVTALLQKGVKKAAPVSPPPIPPKSPTRPPPGQKVAAKAPAVARVSVAEPKSGSAASIPYKGAAEEDLEKAVARHQPPSEKKERVPAGAAAERGRAGPKRGGGALAEATGAVVKPSGRRRPAKLEKQKGQGAQVATASKHKPASADKPSQKETGAPPSKPTAVMPEQGVGRRKKGLKHLLNIVAPKKKRRTTEEFQRIRPTFGSRVPRIEELLSPQAKRASTEKILSAVDKAFDRSAVVDVSASGMSDGKRSGLLLLLSDGNHQRLFLWSSCVADTTSFYIATEEQRRGFALSTKAARIFSRLLTQQGSTAKDQQVANFARQLGQYTRPEKTR